ncbi:hypothetical protein KM043_017257 [Ampulex compressa]|nr:hypothetical protein KM043_017257 [Ampulex compressa]
MTFCLVFSGKSHRSKGLARPEVPATPAPGHRALRETNVEGGRGGGRGFSDHRALGAKEGREGPWAPRLVALLVSQPEVWTRRGTLSKTGAPPNSITVFPCLPTLSAVDP